MNKVEFKKNFEIGYKKMEFIANKSKTIICIENDYSVPSSTVSSSITHIEGSLYEKYRWGWVFTDIEEVESDIFADVTISLGRFEIDPENFDEESFIEHLIEEASEKIKETDYSTVLQKMEVI